MINGPIQVWARGLLGFLQIKNGGVNPAVLGTNVAPVLDLAPWMLETNATTDVQATHQVTLAAGNVGFIGFTVPILVPDDQYWWVSRYSIFTTALGAADAVRFRGCLGRNPVPSQVWLGLDHNDTAIVAAAGDRPIWSGGGFWAYPGDELGMWISSNVVAAPETWTGEVAYTPCHN